MPQKGLRIVYMGTPEFAVEPLRAILEKGWNVSAVVTVPDKPAGRGQKLSQSAVKQFAMQQNLPVLQPERLKDPEFVEQLQNLQPDVMVVVAFRMLPEMVWRVPRLGTFNLHASLLPQYRGAAPINWAVINGETKTGITTFLIDQQIDTGNILLQQEVEISQNETAGELHDRLMALGGRLVVETIELLAEKAIKPQAQELLISSNSDIKPAPKLFKETCRIGWEKPATEVHNLIRGLSPYPAAWTELKTSGNAINAKILRSEMVNLHSTHENPGKILTDNKSFLHVSCGTGAVAVNEIQLAGKRTLPTKDFLMGFKFTEDSFFF